jgi:HD superfamily phosphodiesterase
MDRYESLLITEMKNVFADDPKRIDHALSVLEFTKKIMKIEGGDQEIIVPSAILHDIGIKECERKYHSTMGNLQEKEGPPIAQLILKKIDYPSELIKEILNIIGNHHSPGRVTSLNFQILYEADRLVNLADDFEHLDMAKKEKMIIRNFKTKTGIKLAKNLFLKRR